MMQDHDSIRSSLILAAAGPGIGVAGLARARSLASRHAGTASSNITGLVARVACA